MTFNQSGVIPYRIDSGSIEVLLITSLKRKRWIIPKGYIEFNLTAFESAKKEAYEEAGVLGTNETYELGAYEVIRNERRYNIRVFSLEVTEILDTYPERRLRERKWLNISAAIALVEDELKPFLSSLVKVLLEK